MNLAEQLGNPDSTEVQSSALSLYFPGVITALMQFTDRSVIILVSVGKLL